MLACRPECHAGWTAHSRRRLRAQASRDELAQLADRCAGGPHAPVLGADDGQRREGRQGHRAVPGWTPRSASLRLEHGQRRTGAELEDPPRDPRCIPARGVEATEWERPGTDWPIAYMR